jgi:hypothetical protein
LGDLDLTTDDINFDKIDEDLGRFQQDEIVKEALEKVGDWAPAAALVRRFFPRPVLGLVGMHRRPPSPPPPP